MTAKLRTPKVLHRDVFPGGGPYVGLHSGIAGLVVPNSDLKSAKTNRHLIQGKAMHLTPGEICERYARLKNWEEESLDAFIALLHPEVKWITKWCNVDGKPQVKLVLREAKHARRTSQGLRSVALVSGHPTDDGGHADCVVSVPIQVPDKHDTRTYFKTDGQFITSIFTYSEWMDRTWPYPERVKSKLAEALDVDPAGTTIPDLGLE